MPGADAERLTGIADVRPRDAFREAFVAAVGSGRAVYTPLPGRVDRRRDARPRFSVMRRQPPPIRWDGQPSREAIFREVRRCRTSREHPRSRSDTRQTTGHQDHARDRALRESTHVAGLAMAEAMRSAGPGMHEHEIEAIGDWVFKSRSAQGIAYFGLVATGANAIYPHYHAGTDELKDGDLVLFDYAPDYRLLLVRRDAHVSRQRPLLAGAARAVWHLREALLGLDGRRSGRGRRLRRHRPGRDAVMDRIVGSWSSRPRAPAAAERFVDALRTTSGTRSATSSGWKSTT